MKKTASIVSWITGCLTIFTFLLILAKGHSVSHITCVVPSISSTCQVVVEKVPYEPWMWVVWGVFSAVAIGVLIWREIAVRRGEKTICGILTIIFASIPGGILTLCIPLDDLCADPYY